jgi:cytochrome oxidase Cu insertion factor (SCO1/SenC/PrrC family)
LTLKETLQQFKEVVVSQLDAAAVATMDAATEDLVRAGIAGNAKKVGDPAPDFALPDPHGQPVRLSHLWGRGPVVLTFYRGVW